jgi:hypothetical protein
MRISTLDNMSICIKKHLLPGHVPESGTTLRVLDVGGAHVSGSYRPLFDVFEPDYTVLDLDQVEGSDPVSEPDGRISGIDGQFDVVIAGHTLEQSARFWRIFEEMVRLCADDGLIVVIAPSAGPIHSGPVDCYRFLPDSMNALAELSGTHLIDTWRDARGPFHDLVGVFRKSPPDAEVPVHPPVTSVPLLDLVQNDFPPGAPPEAERGAGSGACEDFLERVHHTLEPRFYVEIGVEYGISLRIAACPALGIDPAPALTEPLAPSHEISLMTSDDFFTFVDVPSRLGPLDLAYIDGMHQIEYVLKDFMNTERHCHAGSVVIIDDIYPVHPLQAERQRSSRYWTGDIWKIIPILRAVRPDLLLLPIDTEPTGSLVVVGLDPTNDTLWDRFDLLVEMAISGMTEVHDDILTREHAFDPRDPLLTRVFGSLRDSRAGDDAGATIELLRTLVAGSLPRKVAHHER